MEKHKLHKDNTTHQKKNSTAHWIISLTLGLLLSFAGVLLMSHLSIKTMKRLNGSESFSELIQLKQALPSQILVWFYQKELKQREQVIEARLLKLFEQEFNDQLRQLQQSPLLYSPHQWLKEDHRLSVLNAHTKKLEELLNQSVHDSTNRAPDYYKLINQSKVFYSILIEWANSLRSQSSPKKPSLKSTNLEIDGINLMQIIKPNLSNVGLTAFQVSTLKQYMFAWLEYLGNKALSRLSDLSDHNAIQKMEPLLVQRLTLLRKLERKFNELFPDLSELLFLKVQRINREFWTRLWSSFVTSFQNSAKNELSQLHILLKFTEYLKLIRAGENKPINELISDQGQNDLATKLPPEIISSWKTRLVSLTPTCFARHLKSLKVKDINHQDLLPWYFKVLPNKKYQEIGLELNMLSLRTRLLNILRQTHISIKDIQHLQNLIIPLKKLVDHRQLLSKRLKQIEYLLVYQWKSFRGSCSCKEGEVNPLKWRDLGPLDRLAPVIYIKSKQDQAVLSRRVGRIKWNLIKHKEFAVQVYDEDQLGDADLILFQNLPTPLELILGTTINKDGCRYQIQLLHIDELEKWLAN